MQIIYLMVDTKTFGHKVKVINNENKLNNVDDQINIESKYSFLN